MNLANKHSWFFATAGIASWIAAGVPMLLRVQGDTQAAADSAPSSLAIGGFAVFGLVLAAAILDRNRSTWRLCVLVAAQSASILVMAFHGTTIVIFPLLVLVAWQATLMMHFYVALAWVLAQTVILATALLPLWAYPSCRIMWGIYLVFQFFAVFAARIARVEESQGRELAQVNAELRATRALLADAVRADERLRISRELHDAWGHELTALSLQLEIASHLKGDAMHESLDEAMSLSRSLMTKVRDVVGTLRIDERCDIAHMLREMVAYLPQPAIHLELPDDITVQSTTHAQVVLRCVQEIITNAIKHADAKNLWLDVSRDGTGIRIVARDDGRGAAAVKPGNGLSGMQARFEELGGRLKFETRAGSGFSLDGWLPQGAAVS